LDFNQPTGLGIRWEGSFTMERSGTVNALRFITKNILAVLMKQSTTIDWLNHYMVLPLAESVNVAAGQQLHVSFQYRAGGSIPSLQNTLRADLVSQSALVETEQHWPAYA
jgi:hypothetical protein